MSVFTGCQVESNEDEKATYTVTYNANGGEGEMKPQSAKEGTEITLTANAFTREGYTFSGWNTAADGKDTDYADKSTIKLTENLTLYAQWTEIVKVSYTVKFDKNGGKGKLPDDITAIVGEEFALPAAELTKTGYDFKGWCASADGTGSTYEAGVKAKDLSTENGATVTLYAKWVLQGSWSINYVLNGDDVNQAQNAETNPAEYNIETATVTLADPTRSLYEFAGWYDNAELSGEKLSGWNAGEKTGDITLYAKWTITQASVSAAIAAGATEIKLAGKISEDEISAIRSALYENSDARINLDLSGTTGLTEIPDFAFFDGDECIACESLAGIVLPEGIESINQYAFRECSNLTDIIIPDSVKIIGDAAFQSSGLASIKFGSGLESIGEYAFQVCNFLTKITVPGNVKTIGFGAFSNCDNLVEAVLEEGVQTIGENAFSSCKKLAKLTIPKTVASIGDIAFYCCDALQTVNYGGTTAEWNALKASIGTDNDGLLAAAIYCTDGIAITANKAAELIKSLESGEYNIAVTGAITSETISAIKNALKNNGKAKVRLDLSKTTGLTSIGDNAFYYCDNLTGVTIPDSVTSIGDSAFFNCDRLTSVNIPDKVISINYAVFYGCTSLTNVNIPDSVTSIGMNAFRYCRSLTSVNIPDSVTSIGDSAFGGCRSLTSLNIPASVTSIGGRAFSACTSLTELTVSEDNSAYKSDGNCIYTKDGTSLIAVAAGLTSVAILDGVTSIGDVFGESKNLINVTIPDSVTSIGDRAFCYCTGLTSVNIPDSVTSIGNSAFSVCSSLTSISIPDGVTSIDSQTFHSCYSLTSVTIPAGVTSIGYSAFYNCNLSTVNFKGSEDQWNAITIEDYNDPLTSATKNYNYTGE